VDFLKTTIWNVLISFTNFKCYVSGFSDVYISSKPLKPLKFHTSCQMVETHNHKYKAIYFGLKVNCHNSSKSFGLVDFFDEIMKMNESNI
jgi:hypothetical protein